MMKLTVACGVILSGLVLGVVLALTGTDSRGPAEPPVPAKAPGDSGRTLRWIGATPEVCHVAPGGKAFEVSLLAMLQDETDDDRVNEMVQRVAAAIPDTNLISVLNALTGSTNRAATELCQLLVRRLAEKDLFTGTSWAEQLSGKPFQSEALRQVALVWANRDVAGAAGWVVALSEQHDKGAALIGVAYEAARKDPIRALELVAGAPPGPERDELLVHALSQWAGTDPSSAWEWASQIPDPVLRDRLLATVAVAAAEQDPAVAAGLIANSLSAGPEQERAAVAVTQRWAQKSPADAASWIIGFPSGPITESAVQNVVGLWMLQDRRAVATWLLQLPHGTLRELGAAAFAQALRFEERREPDS